MVAARPLLMAGAEDLLLLIAICLLHHLDEGRDLPLPTPLRTAEGEGGIPPLITEEEWETDVCQEVQVHEDIREVEARDYRVCLVEEVEGIGQAGEGHDHQVMITGNDSEADRLSLVIAHHTHVLPSAVGHVHHSELAHQL